MWWLGICCPQYYKTEINEKIWNYNNNDFDNYSD